MSLEVEFWPFSDRQYGGREKSSCRRKSKARLTKAAGEWDRQASVFECYISIRRASGSSGRDGENPHDHESQANATGEKDEEIERAIDEASPPVGRQSPDPQSRRRRSRSGLHRLYAGLETRRRAAARRAHHARRSRRAQSCQ